MLRQILPVYMGLSFRYSFILPVLLAILFFSAFAFAASPTSGDVRLRLKDAHQKPVVGAEATIRYQVTDPLYGPLNKVDKLYSDSFGIVSSKIVADFNTPVSVTIRINNLETASTYTWMGSLDRFVNLPLDDFTLRTIDSEANPLGNIPITISGKDYAYNTTTNATGYRILTNYNQVDELTATANYGDAAWARSFYPNGTIIAIQIPTHSLEARAVDENGHLLHSQYTLYYTAVNSETKYTEGVVGLFTQIPTGNITLTVTYGNHSQNYSFYMNYSLSRIFVVDLNSPYVSNPWLVPETPVPENEVFVYAEVFDEGQNSSGIPELVNMIPPVELHYSTDGAEWERVYMFPQNNTTIYRGRIPGQPINTVVRYKIWAIDNVGNEKLTKQYTFNTKVVSPTPNGGDGLGGGILDAIVGFWYLPIAIVLLVLLLFLIKKRYL